MGLFNFFTKNKPQQVRASMYDIVENNETIDIPREVFIEDKEPQGMQTILDNNEQSGIDTIYRFLQADYETKGYSDALTNPDESNRLDGIKLIKLDLHILIGKANSYYDKRMYNFDFHINSRIRAGLIDLVEELRLEKEKILSDVQRIKEIESSLVDGNGMVERVILSYKKGFMRGISAITQSKILK